MEWFKRNLRPNRSVASPQSVVFFDTETIPTPDPENSLAEIHSFRLGCATAARIRNGKFVGRKELDFDTKEQFWKWLDQITEPKYPTWIFAHNIGFDATIVGLWDKLEARELELINPLYKPSAKALATGTERPPEPLLILEDPPTVVRVYNKQGSQFLFVDTLNYWRISLAAIGKLVGSVKLSMPEFNDSNADWFQYCRQDVKVLEVAILELINWIKAEDLGKFRFTVGSQAMGAYRHRFMPEKITFHNDANVRKLERDGYYGGRLDNFYVGKIAGGIHQFDVSSLYPSVMRGNQYPVDLIDTSIWGASRERIARYRFNQLVAKVRLNTQSPEFPVRHDNLLIYPTGDFWTTLSGPDLEYADSIGAIQEIDTWAAYRTAEIFTEYVDYFWEKRKDYKQKGNGIYDGFTKLLLNSLYGKFSQRGIEWRDYPIVAAPKPYGHWEHKEAWCNEFVSLRALGWRTQRRVDSDDYPTSFPAIAAWVTAYGRQRMREYREICGRENYYYQATDSLYTTATGAERLEKAGVVTPSTLGKLKLEGIAECADFRSLNNYTFGDKIVRGTIKPKAVQTDEKTWVEPRFQHLACVINGKTRSTIRVEQASKTLVEEYRKGTILPSGWVEPFHLSLS